MREVIKFKGLEPARAEGRVRIDLWEPATKKVVHTQKGQNYVFPCALLCGQNGEWATAISAAYLELSDCTEDIDTTIPYMIGNTIGYGVPSNGSSGLYRGAYSVANQVLAAKNELTSLRWKFQYDFTPDQANGTIGRIGLTNQHREATELQHPARFPGYTALDYERSTCDGRYCYSCSAAGVVSIKDMYVNTTETVDISALVGTIGNKYVAYAPATGKMYIYLYSSTAASRRMFVFTDNTFSTLEATFTPTNLALTDYAYPMYVHGTFVFQYDNYTSLKGADFVNNTSPITYTPPNLVFYTPSHINYYTIGFKKYVFSQAIYYRSRGGVIFDMETKTFVGTIAAPAGMSSSGGYGHARVPFVNEFIAGQTKYNGGHLFTNPAIAMKKLEEPVTKTSANGMTVTYELEVFW